LVHVSFLEIPPSDDTGIYLSWVCGPFSKKIPKRKGEYIVPHGRQDQKDTQTDLLQNVYTFPCTSGRRGGLIDVYFIIVRAYCHHYRILPKKKASQKNPKPYPKKVLIKY
jgi:hypothetical protein